MNKVLNPFFSKRVRERERAASHMNYTGVKYLFVMPSVLHSERENEPRHILITKLLHIYL